MIITIFSEDDGPARSMIAIHLAALCAHNHRRVALVDATGARHGVNWNKRRQFSGARMQVVVRDAKNVRLELDNPESHLRTHFQDIVIDADGTDAWHADTAITATDVLLVPLRFYQGDFQAPQKLRKRIASLRSINPAVGILIVDVLALSAQSDAEQLAFDVLRMFANKIDGVRIAGMVLQEREEDRIAFNQGLSPFDAAPQSRNSHAAIKALYQEILSSKNLPADTPPEDHAMINAIRRWTQGCAQGMR